MLSCSTKIGGQPARYFVVDGGVAASAFIQRATPNEVMKRTPDTSITTAVIPARSPKPGNHSSIVPTTRTSAASPTVTTVGATLLASRNRDGITADDLLTTASWSRVMGSAYTRVAGVSATRRSPWPRLVAGLTEVVRGRRAHHLQPYHLVEQIGSGYAAEPHEPLPSHVRAVRAAIKPLPRNRCTDHMWGASVDRGSCSGTAAERAHTRCTSWRRSVLSFSTAGSFSIVLLLVLCVHVRLPDRASDNRTRQEVAPAQEAPPRPLAQAR